MLVSVILVVGICPAAERQKSKWTCSGVKQNLINNSYCPVQLLSELYTHASLLFIVFVLFLLCDEILRDCLTDFCSYIKLKTYVRHSWGPCTVTSAATWWAPPTKCNHASGRSELHEILMVHLAELLLCISSNDAFFAFFFFNTKETDCCKASKSDCFSAFISSNVHRSHTSLAMLSHLR